MAALVGGFAVALGTRDVYNGLESRSCDALRCNPTGLDNLKSQALLADVLFGTAALAGVSAIIFYAASGTSSGPEHALGASVAVSPSNQGASLLVGGHF
jgi:hypothetical protein